MRLRNKPGFGELIASTVCLLVVLIALVAIDDRVQHRFTMLVSQAASEGVPAWRDRVVLLGDAVIESARDHSMEHAPLLVFSAAGAVLLVFMLRT